MEVHHHADLHHKTKKFKEYFLEFLMIFLAVTMGFFAEQVREHFADRAREKEYMKEIVENLKYDSIRCVVNSQSNIQIALGLDSLRAVLKEAVGGKVNANASYYYALQYVGPAGRAVFNTSAITELKNSGSLRLIGNKKLVSELADYYERKINAAQIFSPSAAYLADLEKNRNQFFSLVGLDDFIQSFGNISEKTYSNNYDYKNILNHVPALELLKSDPVELQQFYTQVSEFEMKIKNYNFWLSYCQKAGEKLIAEIKKEYGLENY